MVDLIGFRVASATGIQLCENYPERSYKSMLIPVLQEDGEQVHGLLAVWKLMDGL